MDNAYLLKNSYIVHKDNFQKMQLRLPDYGSCETQIQIAGL